MLTEHVPSVATEQTRSQLHDADSQVQEAFLQACQFSTVTRKFLPNRSAFLAVWPWPTHVTSLDRSGLTEQKTLSSWDYMVGNLHMGDLRVPTLG